MAMKTTKITLTTLLLVVCFTASSKDRFVMAKIIMNNKDTVVNPNKYDNVFDFQARILMKNDDGKMQVIYPKEAKGFYILAGVADTLYFESVCGLKFGFADDPAEVCYFMMKKRCGKIPLYYYVLTKLVKVGVSMQSVYSPAYILKYKDEWLVMEENNYVNQLLKFIKPMKKNNKQEVVNKLSNLEDDLFSRAYRFEDFPTVVDRINDILK